MPDKTVNIYNACAKHPVVLVCEHASAFMPERFNQLGLTDAASASHVAWDPGASAVAHHLADELNAVLVESTVSRLLYDCNRPPESSTAVPVQSEIYPIPGNENLTEQSRNARAQEFYFPFEQTLAQTLADHPSTPILVTIHSFTPIYHGRQRTVEIGILHDSDQRLADAILHSAQPYADQFNVQRNQPYGPKDGVTHTLLRHGVQNRLLNVMLEIRNDLIATSASQQSVASRLRRWIDTALQTLNGHDTHQSRGAL